MAKKHLLLLIIFLTCTVTARANFNFNANCIDAYKAIYSFRINEAKLLIQKEKEQNPQNGIIVLLENYIDYFSLLASESKTDYDRLKDNRSARVSELENNEKNSPYYLFSQAEVYLQWGLLKAKFGDYFSSSMDLKKAASLLRDNAQKYPDFLPNQKSIGLINVIFGAIPSNLKSVTRFLGMSGNVQGGIKQLEELRTALPKTKYSFYKDEVIFFLCNIDIDILRNKNNYAKLASYLAGMENNGLLKVYLQGYVASKTAHNDAAISFLEAVPKSNQYLDVPTIYYLLGNAKLNRRDNDAPVFLNKYIKDYKGRNYLKDAYLKLAYFYLLENDVKRYDSYLKLVRSKGYTFDEKDQQALREANDNRPDTDLLKARFYFDGGYYNKALAEIKNKDENDLKLPRDKIELFYRLGRIYEKTEKLNDALANYQKAINLGKTSGYYYAATAAVRIGNIYEQREDFNRAANFYNQAINMKNFEYQTGIQNEAKEGLKRIGR
ncbi:MAG TPA: tetratricopeptide repeat protein [Mucilaginibacter sp.]|jgi:tetratricopeptide (TPR) repeat protein|nr:tetratricopeptide repeat protein [Mucilaginibacter sp.]